MPASEPSSIHLDPAALNALLDQFVNASGQAEARFVDGKLELRAAGLTVTVDSVTIDEGGVDVKLRLG